MTALLGAIPSPPSNGFHVGPLFFHAYGIAYVVAVAAAIIISRRRWARVGGDPELPVEIAMWAFPAGLVGGRIYFDVTTPAKMPHHWWGPFAIWDGGLGIWGGVAGGVIAGLWVAHRRLTHEQMLQLMDIVGPALLVSQSIGRLGNYFNQELFGGPSSLPWALEISRAHRVAELAPRYWRYSTFEPTFLYEIVWNMLWFGVLSWLWRRRAVRAPGLFWLYVAGYSGFRVFEETQRIDYSNYFLGMRVNFWIASLLCVFALACFALVQRGFRGWGAPAAEPAPPGTRYGRNPASPPPEVPRPSGTVAPAGAGSAGGSGSTGTRRPPPPPRKRSRRGR
ncbi:MAG TPA: prolipoprotein diacylglyceryl transferase [Solirubrobacteraceae bacterium]|nr:prolipoprotein diacylglyceryl transferase [Solirubrobacteraceae bacterium]